MRRKAFTMLELIFVIVIIGIIAKFGVEMLVKAYDNYLFSTVQNRLEQSTGFALQEIANRLSYRIKPSVIVRDKANHDFTSDYTSLADANSSLGSNAILEWIGYDDAGFRGSYNGTWNAPDWSGFIDVNNPAHTSSILISPETNTTAENDVIKALSGGSADINTSAIYFIGSNTNIHGFGWGGAIKNQQQVMHPIESNATNIDILQSNPSKFPSPSDFNGTRVYEFYQLAWSAYALVYSDANASQNVGYIQKLDNNNSNNLFGNVLPHGLKAGTGNGEWQETSVNHYVVHISGKNIPFKYDPTNGTFTCSTTAQTTGTICKGLTK